MGHGPRRATKALTKINVKAKTRENFDILILRPLWYMLTRATPRHSPPDARLPIGIVSVLSYFTPLVQLYSYWGTQWHCGDHYESGEGHAELAQHGGYPWSTVTCKVVYVARDSARSKSMGLKLKMVVYSIKPSKSWTLVDTCKTLKAFDPPKTLPPPNEGWV